MSTWDFGETANAAAWRVLAGGGAALDAVEAGAKVPEADPENHTVGLGGYPDRDGHVTLDACVMDHLGNLGAVACLEDVVHAVSVARRVMEKTPHVLLVGEGARQFALAEGFPRQNLLTPAAEKAWREWLKTSEYKPVPNIEQTGLPQTPATSRSDRNRPPSTRISSEMSAAPTALAMERDAPVGAHGAIARPARAMPVVDRFNHDTIGILALDRARHLAGACTTSGMAFKLHGRVGDSPIAGAGLFVDGEIGAATATGVGEECLRICGSHTVVELMRHGRSPEQACREAVERIARRYDPPRKDLQMAFIALHRDGRHGGYALQKGFTYAVTTADGTRQIAAPSLT
ncbi:MAG TPA: N(4)-(beta-N-acetylglucosaminyl)-L-asparaginase [Xanthomonadaceae bacterium]|nr:N(4)-(beta-N-acetylglucosaminyl)-L-asparaginase [Xanthomonadaceae bacterium]